MKRDKFFLKRPIVVINYGVGNILSVTNALERLGYCYVVSNKESDINTASALILPGVGAFEEAMKNLHDLNLIKVLEKAVLIQKKPILGICLGMQIFASSSNENGFHQGLGWISGEVIKLSNIGDMKIPHVGWNTIDTKKSIPLFSEMKENSSPHYYFDHSYHFVCEEKFVNSTCDYGKRLIVGVQKENIFGVQFHPEKSQLDGFRLFKGFFEYVKSQFKHRMVRMDA
jgi:imidazole glycerol-phosphate synthase subunit HisH